MFSITLLSQKSIPKTTSGKVRRQHAKQLYLQGCLPTPLLSVESSPVELLAEGNGRDSFDASDLSDEERLLAEWIADRIAEDLNTSKVRFLLPQQYKTEHIVTPETQSNSSQAAITADSIPLDRPLSEIGNNNCRFSSIGWLTHQITVDRNRLSEGRTISKGVIVLLR